MICFEEKKKNDLFSGSRQAHDCLLGVEFDRVGTGCWQSAWEPCLWHAVRVCVWRGHTARPPGGNVPSTGSSSYSEPRGSLSADLEWILGSDVIDTVFWFFTKWSLAIRMNLILKTDIHLAP